MSLRRSKSKFLFHLLNQMPTESYNHVQHVKIGQRTCFLYEKYTKTQVTAKLHRIDTLEPSRSIISWYILNMSLISHSTSPDLAPDMVSLNWVHDPSGDGHTISVHNRTITVSNIFTNSTRILVNATQMPKRIEGFVPNVDHSKVLYVNGTRKGYRYSKYSNYFVQDLKSGSYEALVPGQKSDISLALWSPK